MWLFYRHGHIKKEVSEAMFSASGYISVLSVRVVMEGAEEAHGSVTRAPFHWLHFELDNVHRTRVAPLSAEQCLRVFYASLTKATRVITARQPALAWG